MLRSCGRCGTSYGPDAWADLRVVEQVTSHRVRELVTVWPDATGVEVRECRCGNALARRVRVEFESRRSEPAHPEEP